MKISLEHFLKTIDINMLNSILYETSTIESQTQSPKKSKIQISSNIQIPNFNLNLKKISDKKNIFPQKEGFFGKIRKIEAIKESENCLTKERISKNILKKKIDEKSLLLDYDFLIGEILNKINLKNNLLSAKVKQKKKIGIKKGKSIKKKICIIPSSSDEQKSKKNK